MAKRFIDTELFSDEWFGELSKDGKLFFVYFITSCDHAGVLRVNKKLCEFQTGIKSTETVIKELNKCLVTVKEGTYFMPKFLKFQYPDFPKSKVRAQDGALKILNSLGITLENLSNYLTVNKELPNSYGNEHDNGIDNDNVKKEKEEKIIPDQIEFLNYCKEVLKEKYQPLEFSLKAKYDSWVENKWKDGNGSQIKNWKTKIRNTIPFLKPEQTKFQPPAPKFEKPIDSDAKYERELQRYKQMKEAGLIK